MKCNLGWVGGVSSSTPSPDRGCLALFCMNGLSQMQYLCVWGQGPLEVSGTWVTDPACAATPAPAELRGFRCGWRDSCGSCLSRVSRQTEPLWNLGTALSTCWAQWLQFEVFIGVKLASLLPVICYMQLLGDAGSAFISVLLSTVST